MRPRCWGECLRGALMHTQNTIVPRQQVVGTHARRCAGSPVSRASRDPAVVAYSSNLWPRRERLALQIVPLTPLGALQEPRRKLTCKVSCRQTTAHLIVAVTSAEHARAAVGAPRLANWARASFGNALQAATQTCSTGRSSPSTAAALEAQWLVATVPTLRAGKIQCRNA
jgi:hypothetical protein